VGATTALCVIVGFCFGLNHVSLQITNHLMWPLQVPLMLFFVRAGEKLFHAHPLPLAPAALGQALAAGPLEFLRAYGAAGLQGALVWALLAPALVLAVYGALAPLFQRAAARAAVPALDKGAAARAAVPGLDYGAAAPRRRA
jgi:hypothetical protein